MLTGLCQDEKKTVEGSIGVSRFKISLPGIKLSKVKEGWYEKIDQTNRLLVFCGKKCDLAY